MTKSARIFFSSRGEWRDLHENAAKVVTIGLAHGRGAPHLVQGSINFYANLFYENNGLKWTDVRVTASKFGHEVEARWPAYHDEMKGIAEGADVTIEDIIALNVRTEINFGMIMDGCTAFACQTSSASYLAQNWDWKAAQKANLIAMTITQPGMPTIKMVTEAGIIGKIGLNSAGVGVCLNAIRAKGADATRIPCHLGLRKVLESSSAEQAEAALRRSGVASACHMLIADENRAIGLECSSLDIRSLEPDNANTIVHTNHFVVDHPGVHDTNWLADSTPRLERAQQLSSNIAQEAASSQISTLFQDTKNQLGSICRTSTGPSDSETVFHICMELRSRTAVVKVGKPDGPDQELHFEF